MEILKKITYKGIVGVPTSAEIKDAIKNDQEIIPGHRLCVVGYANSIHTQTNVNRDTGEVSTYEGLSGDFVAYDAAKPSEKFSSGVAYFPSIVHGLLKGKLGSGTVEFAVEIACRLPREGEKAPAGYIFIVRPLIEPENSSPMARLLARVSGDTLAIAPEAGQEEPAPTEAKKK